VNLRLHLILYLRIFAIEDSSAELEQVFQQRTEILVPRPIIVPQVQVLSWFKVQPATTLCMQ
jgi:hypothetical protein